MYLEKLSQSDSESLLYFSLAPLSEKEVTTMGCLTIAGWVVGKKSRVVKIELVCDNQILENIPVNHHRPDVKAVYPQIQWSGESGFLARIDIGKLLTQVESHSLVIKAVLENNDYIPMAELRSQESLLNQLQKVREKKIEGDQLSALDKYSEAIRKYEEAIKINSWYAPAFQALGDTFVTQSKISEAIKAYRQAINLNPDDLYCYQQLIKLGYLDEFYQCCQQALEKNPNHITLKSFYLPSLESQSIPKLHLSKAINFLKDLHQKKPNNIQILINISILLKNIGNLDESELYIRKSLDLDTNNISALSELGKILEAKNQWREAADCYRKSMKLHDKTRLLNCIYNSYLLEKENFDYEVASLIKQSKVVEFIRQEILSELKLEYEDHLILYQSASNVGDTCKHFALIKPLCIQHSRKAIVFYPSNQSPVTQAHLFLDPIMPDYVTSHFPIDESIQQIIQRLTAEDGFSLSQLPLKPGIPRIIIGTNPMHKLDYITKLSTYNGGKAASLGISIELNDNTIGKPMIKESSLVNATEKFDNLKLLQGKAVLVAPHSVSINRVIGSNATLIPFWQKVINKLVKENITPIINVKHRGEKLDYLSTLFSDDSRESIKFVDLQLDEVIPFIELCGAFAGVRSGLCDLVAFSKRNLTKLCIEPVHSQSNYFGKLPGQRNFDKDIINDNFHLYFLSVKNIPEDEEINQIVNLFLAEGNTAKTVNE
jgi:tetratricopeptide (TPR) repeat protein